MGYNSEDLIDCPVLEVCHLLGKKWMCPLIVNFKPNKCYSFEEIIKLSSRRINRTLLSNLLKDMISFELLHNEGNCYSLTKKGFDIKSVLNNLKDIVLIDYSEAEKRKFKENCLVNSFKN